MSFFLRFNVVPTFLFSILQFLFNGPSNTIFVPGCMVPVPSYPLTLSIVKPGKSPVFNYKLTGTDLYCNSMLIKKSYILFRAKELSMYPSVVKEERKTKLVSE